MRTVLLLGCVRPLYMQLSSVFKLPLFESPFNFIGAVKPKIRVGPKAEVQVRPVDRPCQGPPFLIGRLIKSAGYTFLRPTFTL
jgi:hypothetical protein